jgi:hypothetical protein
MGMKVLSMSSMQDMQIGAKNTAVNLALDWILFKQLSL